MITTARKPNRRWAAPAAAAGLVIASPAIWASVANAEPTLPERSADQIIADVLAARPVALAGEVSQRVELGLPDLGMGSSVDLVNPMSLFGLAQGTNTWRIWYDGEQSYRVSIIRGHDEADLISNGEVTWSWSSATQTAVRFELEPAPTGENRPVPQGSPAEAAKQILAQLEEYSTVATDSNVRVAGHAAYELVITPADEATRVQQVRLAVDAETNLPLRVQVFSTTTGTAVIDIGFTQLNYEVPNASTFEFTPPPTAEVVEGNPEIPVIDQQTGEPAENLPVPSEQLPAESHPGDSTEVSGEGWSSVRVVTPASGAVADAEMLRQYLPPVSGDWGSGVLLDGTLFSIVFADDGRVAFGAVAPEVLYQALA